MINEDITHKLEDIKYIMKDKILHLKDMIRPIGKPVFIHRIEIPCESIDILDWLSLQDDSIKVYWAGRKREIEIGGIGAADVIKFDHESDLELLFEHVNERFNQLNINLKYFGGMAFDDKNIDDQWEAFGKLQFVAPRFEMIEENGINVFVCNIAYHEIYKEKLQELADDVCKIIFDSKPSIKSLKQPTNRIDSPDKKDFGVIFSDTKSLLDSNKLKKVVLARKSSFTFKSPVDGFSIKQKLKPISPECYHFCFQPEKNTYFIGASPEQLYKRESNKIVSEAIAGTRPRGKTKEEDKAFRQELIESEKDLTEHNVVVDSISASLNSLCQNISIDEEPSILELYGAYHLKTLFKGILADDSSDVDVIRLLHPTPAVSGYPKEEALNFINNIEPFNRGWYAGLFGYIGQNSTELAVAIRSGLINKSTISLFAGAGIISSSDKEKEWEEVENKMNHFFSVFTNDS